MGSENIIECLSLQLSELELLQSMYSKEELLLEESTVPSLFQRVIDGLLKYYEAMSRLGFVINISTPSYPTVELVCRLPHDYPLVSRPELFLRVSCDEKSSYQLMRESFDAFLCREITTGDICISIASQWVEDNVVAFLHPISDGKSQSTSVRAVSHGAAKSQRMERLWIYCHHIFSKFKRKDILDWADELNLSGFCLPGKPGVICAEGGESEVEEYWYRLRRMTWKQIQIKEKEVFDASDIDSARAFDKFAEKNFECRAGKGREYHMDLGLLYKFLEEKGFGAIFKLYFGVDGTSHH